MFFPVFLEPSLPLMQGAGYEAASINVWTELYFLRHTALPSIIWKMTRII